LTYIDGLSYFWHMKKPKLEVRPYRHSMKNKFVLDLRAYGKGRKFFATRSAAEDECRRQEALWRKHSREAIGLSPREMSELIQAKQELAKYDEAISDAVKFRVDYLERIRRSGVTVAQLTDEVLKAKSRDGMSEAYLADLKVRLGRFSADFGTRAIAGITVEEIDDWLRNLEGSPKSRANYRTNVGVLFSYATKRRILDFNPVLHTAKPKLSDNPPEIFTVDQLRALLEAARRVEPDVLPMLAIGAFAGVRDAEIKRLDWHEIDLVRGHIEIKGAKAKSARRRIIPIQPNLAAWLRPYAAMQGSVAPEGSREKIDRACEAGKLARWPINGLRHSFASYRLATIHDAPRVASELGHTSPQMLYSTYRELVLPQEAERYWKIEPAAEGGNLVAFSVSA
jgi:integrase